MISNVGGSSQVLATKSSTTSKACFWGAGSAMGVAGRDSRDGVSCISRSGRLLQPQVRVEQTWGHPWNTGGGMTTIVIVHIGASERRRWGSSMVTCRPP